jgi:hypothetical protein
MSSSVSVGRREPASPDGVDPREAIATTATRASVPSVVRKAFRPRWVLSIAG